MSTEVSDFSIKERPRTLEDFAGNDTVVSQVKCFIETNTFPKAALFSGDFGCGKTTLVYIVKNLLQCSDLNFVEINGAKENGVDDIRESLENIKLVALGKSKTKIIFIDEAHKLTKAATSALLKDTEAKDNPNVYFMFATNLPDKIDPALRSRLTEFKLKPLSSMVIAKDVLFPICQKHNLDISKEVLKKIGEVSKGCSRDALVLLNKIQHVSPENRIIELDNLACNSEEHRNLMSELLNKRISYKDALIEVSKLEVDPESFRFNIMRYLGSILLNPNTDMNTKQKAYNMTLCFGESYYNTLTAGLGLSLFDYYNK